MWPLYLVFTHKSAQTMPLVSGAQHHAWTDWFKGEKLVFLVDLFIFLPVSSVCPRWIGQMLSREVVGDPGPAYKRRWRTVEL